MTDNSPYAPPQSTVEDAPQFAGTDAELLRSAHIRHEVQLKSVGALYYLSGGLLTIGSFPILITSVVSLFGRARVESGALVLLGLFYLALGAALVGLGYGYRRLRSWVRIPGGILSAIGLLAFPVGTLINGWILYLMFGSKGQVVLAQDYREIIDATPHIVYQRSVGDWIAIGILIAMLAGIILLVLLSTMR